MIALTKEQSKTLTLLKGFAIILVVIDCMLMYRLMRTAVDKWNMTWLVNISAASFSFTSFMSLG